MLVRGLIFFLDDRLRYEHAGVSIVYEHVSYEKSEAALLQIKQYMSGTSKIKLQTCLLLNALDSRVNIR